MPWFKNYIEQFKAYRPFPSFDPGCLGWWFESTQGAIPVAQLAEQSTIQRSEFPWFLITTQRLIGAFLPNWYLSVRIRQTPPYGV